MAGRYCRARWRLRSRCSGKPSLSFHRHRALAGGGRTEMFSRSSRRTRRPPFRSSTGWILMWRAGAASPPHRAASHKTIIRRPKPSPALPGCSHRHCGNRQSGDHPVGQSVFLSYSARANAAALPPCGETTGDLRRGLDKFQRSRAMVWSRPPSWTNPPGSVLLCPAGAWGGSHSFCRGPDESKTLEVQLAQSQKMQATIGQRHRP
jgi:hypothetical protein